MENEKGVPVKNYFKLRANSGENFQITPDGRIFWKQREVETDDEFRVAMVELKDALRVEYTIRLNGFISLQDATQELDTQATTVENRASRFALSADPDDWWKADALRIRAHGIRTAINVLMNMETEKGD